MHIAILGRQPHLSVAELERLYGAKSVRWFSESAAIITSQAYCFDDTAGTQKAGRIVTELKGNWKNVSQKIIKAYAEAWSDHEGKITLGISAYGFSDATARSVQKTGIILKKKLREHDVSVRLIPNSDAALNTATSHHNKLGLSDNKVELIVIKNNNNNVIVAESVGAQNITALARRDQERPKRDAFVGMLPPKLAKLIVNLAVGDAKNGTVLDPFCGTGVVLQEAMLRGFDVYGTDLAEKMVQYSQENIQWLARTHHIDEHTANIECGDAMKHQWSEHVSYVAAETYLGQPFSAPPSPAKQKQVQDNCNHIIGDFLKNLHTQLDDNTTLCIAVPAWRGKDGGFTHLPLIQNIEAYGYERIELTHVRDEHLIYYREDQVVARQLLILKNRVS